MALSCEMRPQRCLVWITSLPYLGDNLRSPPFFLKYKRCQLIFHEFCSNSKGNNYSLRIEADLPDQCNYRTVISLEHDNVTGLTAIGDFGHSHPSPQTIWEFTEDDIWEAFTDIYDDLKVVLTFVSTSPDDKGEAVQPTLSSGQSLLVQSASLTRAANVEELQKKLQERIHLLQGKTEQTVKIAEMATTFSNPNVVSCLEILSGDLSKLLDGDSRQDVEFKCEGGVVRAHSNLLSTRSPVIAAMLRSDMAEGRTGHVNIPDMEAELFRCFIRYLYTGKLPALTIETARRLYEAGDKYEVQGLTRRCSHFLKQHLAIENACELLVLAEAHSDQQFKEDVVAFILDKRIFLEDDHWLVFSDGHPKLAHEVVNRFCKQEFRKK